MIDPITILSLVMAGLKAAPEIAKAAVSAKNAIAQLFRHGLITKAQQDAAHAHVDNIQAAALRGETLPHWTVEPDPVTPGSRPLIGAQMFGADGRKYLLLQPEAEGDGVHQGEVWRAMPDDGRDYIRTLASRNDAIPMFVGGAIRPDWAN